MEGLPSFLTDDQKEQIEYAIKENKPILVTGPQGPTGKTTLIRFLKESGITAYEEWECEFINLNVPLGGSNRLE